MFFIASSLAATAGFVGGLVGGSALLAGGACAGRIRNGSGGRGREIR